MRKTFLYLFLLAFVTVLVTACQNDDTDFFSQYTLTSGNDDDDENTKGSADTIYIAWNGSSVSVSGDRKNYVSKSGADVTVNTGTDEDSLLLVLSGTTDDGSLLVYRQKKYGILLNGVSITNVDGSAINNQCSKALYFVCAEGTTNTLTDGTAYNETVNYQQKGALFSEGQTYFSGGGILNVYGNCKNAIACDDYITIVSDITINAVTSETGTNGIKANDGMFINGGILNVNVASDGGRGIRCEARTVITGGTTTIKTSGDCKIEKINGVADTTSAAGIKCDSLFTMSAGQLTITSTGDGGKGIRCDENVEFSGGTLEVKTTGSNDQSKPKAIKSDTGIIVSGGSFTATVKKSSALDNGSDSDNPSDNVTVLGTPATSSIAKKSVIITY